VAEKGETKVLRPQNHSWFVGSADTNTSSVSFVNG